MEKVSFLDANLVRILQKPKQQWFYHRKKVLGSKRFASFDKPVDWNVYNTKNYLFTHCTIVASVKLQKDGFTISDPCQQLVNANGNAWSNEVLTNSFRTFVGKPNFYQHYQIQGFEKGIILDSILRPVVYVGSNGKTAQVYYVDLLVATNRKHKDLVDRIIKGQLSTLSMGCTAAIVQCSYCGKIFKDDQEQCDHLKYHLRQYLDRNGKKVIVSELIGALDKNGKYIPKSCQFIEASWVETPAFEGACLNYFIAQQDIKANQQAKKVASQKITFNDFSSYFSASTLSQLRVADKYSYIAIKLMQEQLKKQEYLNIAKSIYRGQ